ncbi:MAG: Eco29kI family restriction endonuclease [Streptosporangiaceae bacterium]
MILADSLSRVTHYAPTFYDPMGTENVTSAICRELERQPLVLLDPPIDRFDGSGLYAIYYRGATRGLYAPLAGLKIPVYVGQALSHNSATGAATGGRNPLWNRVQEHSQSIGEAQNLHLADFGVRLLLLPDVHSDLGENGLRVFYRPVWNAILTGFGSHEQGATTRQSSRSRWDTVHPGRNRTFGASRHDPDVLMTRSRTHIASQLANYQAAPWRQEADS